VLRRAGVAQRLLRGLARGSLEVRRGAFDAVVLCDDLDGTLPALGWLVPALLPGDPPIAAICHEPRPRSRRRGEGDHVESRALRWALSRLYSRLDLVLLHGERSRAEFDAAWPPARTAVIPHGDHRIFGGGAAPPATEARVLYFGEWRRVKGLEVLLDAFDLLAERMPKARLTIAGQPADVDPALVRARAARWGDRVEIVDRYLAMDEVPALFARSRVVALPYLAASQSGVLHLAMTQGRAVVASAVGELATVVGDGETGVLVPSGDAESLAAALERVLCEPALAAELGAAGQRRLEQDGSWERVAEVLEGHLESLVAQPSSR
jgi:glycosyltransferase involved in cell wall biosynthesis